MIKHITYLCTRFLCHPFEHFNLYILKTSCLSRGQFCTPYTHIFNCKEGRHMWKRIITPNLYDSWSRRSYTFLQVQCIDKFISYHNSQHVAKIWRMHVLSSIWRNWRITSYIPLFLRISLLYSYTNAFDNFPLSLTVSKLKMHFQSSCHFLLNHYFFELHSWCLCKVCAWSKIICFCTRKSLSWKLPYCILVYTKVTTPS